MWKHVVYGTNGNTRVIVLCEDVQGNFYFTVRDLDRSTINDATLLKEWVKNATTYIVFQKAHTIKGGGAQNMARELKEMEWDHVFIYEESITEKITNRVTNLEPT